MMQWNDLKAFATVAEHGSFSRAAEELHLTQPAVSKRVQALERALKTRLFDRIGKRVYLTDAGALLLPRARGLLRDVSDTERLLTNLTREVRGNLSLATSHHVGLHRLAPVLKTFTRHYPDVQLDIRFEDSEAAADLVRRADSELAVVTLDPDGDAELDYLQLWDDPLCFVAAAEHPLTAAGPMTLADIAQHAAILPGMATYTGRIVASVFAAAGLAVRPAMSTNYLETIAMLVSTGLGWSVLPTSMLGDDVHKIEVDTPTMRRTLGCVTHPGRTPSNAAVAFREVLLKFRDPKQLQKVR